MGDDMMELNQNLFGQSWIFEKTVLFHTDANDVISSYTISAHLPLPPWDFT